MAHILIVCTANICRSPLVEAILRRQLHERGLTDWEVSSAGTWAQFERGAARYSQKIAQRIGLDLSEHVSRIISAEIIDSADLIIVMTKSHQESLRVEFRSARDKIFLLSEMIGKKYDVTDPYGGPSEGYEEMFFEVSHLIEKGLPRIIELAQSNVVEA